MGRGEGTGAHNHTLAVPCGESLPPQLKLVVFPAHPHHTASPCYLQAMLGPDDVIKCLPPANMSVISR